MKPSICLTMIVKNEAHIIERLIASVRPFIDAWVIVDTGSTDNTEAVARAALAGLPGEYSSAEWNGYGPSRTVALRRAEALSLSASLGVTYAMIVDADDIWSGDRPELTEDAHSVWFELPGARWSTARFLKLLRGFTYEGVCHEYPAINGTIVAAPLLDGITITTPSDGSSHTNPSKYLEHAKMISRALVDDPANTRYAFYLAQSYRDHGDDRTAAVLYLMRAAMGSSTEPEQVYVSFLEAGRALARLGQMDASKRALLNAHGNFPGRREAPAELARLFAVTAATSPTVGTLFVETGASVGDEE